MRCENIKKTGRFHGSQCTPGVSGMVSCKDNPYMCWDARGSVDIVKPFLFVRTFYLPVFTLSVLIFPYNGARRVVRFLMFTRERAHSCGAKKVCPPYVFLSIFKLFHPHRRRSGNRRRHHQKIEYRDHRRHRHRATKAQRQYTFFT